MNPPSAITVNSAGTLFIAISSTNQIRTASSVGVITNFAGTFSYGCSFIGDGGAATSASLCYPSGLALGLSGSLYIADTFNCRIRMVDSSGIITTVAGAGYGYTGDGGQATLATFVYPRGVAVNSVGTLFIADSGNHVIRMISTAGIITTIAGTGGVSGSTGDALGQSEKSTGSLEEHVMGSSIEMDQANVPLRPQPVPQYLQSTTALPSQFRLPPLSQNP